MKSKEQEASAFPKIGSPAIRALEAARYSRLEQLTKITEAELGQLHGMGPKNLCKNNFHILNCWLSIRSTG